MKLLLKNGCDDNEDDATCLYLAAQANSHDLVTYLLSLHAPCHDYDHLSGFPSCFIEGGYDLHLASPNNMGDYLAMVELDYHLSYETETVRAIYSPTK